VQLKCGDSEVLAQLKIFKNVMKTLTMSAEFEFADDLSNGATELADINCSIIMEAVN
jgi:hypothetical protein